MWKPIPGFEGLYEVSDTGLVRSLPREVRCRNGVVRHLAGKVMKPWLHRQGYLVASLRKDGKYKAKLIHQWVMLAFVGPCPRGQEVLHWNGIKDDNRLSNLRYGTQTENWNDSKRLAERGGYLIGEVPIPKGWKRATLC